jgi:TRAP-type C4-dicarboxylate transport system substrate-binding protein
MSGIKMRVPQNPGWDKVYKELGSEPVVIALPEMYKALQSNIVQGSEGPASQIDSYRLNEVQKYLILSNHQVAVGILCISDSSYKKFNDNDKKIIEKAASEACAFGNDYALKSENDIIKKLGSSGMTIITPDRESFRTKAKKVVDEFFKTEWNVTTWDEVSKL